MSETIEQIFLHEVRDIRIRVDEKLNVMDVYEDENKVQYQVCLVVSIPEQNVNHSILRNSEKIKNWIFPKTLKQIKL